MQDFKKLYAWQKSHALAVRTYEVSETFPHHQRYALCNQMRRAATSIPANIAEGCSRGSRRELAQYLRIALGSAGELESYAVLATDLQLRSDLDRFVSEIQEVKRLLAGLLKAVNGRRAEEVVRKMGN